MMAKTATASGLTCYLLLAKSEPQRLQRLVEALRTEQTRFLIHLDRTADETAFQALIDLDHVQLINTRIETRDAGFSMVEAILLLMQKASSSFPKASRFTLLSEAWYPAASNAALDALTESPANFISMRAIAPEAPLYACIARRHLPDHAAFDAGSGEPASPGQLQQQKYLRKFLETLPDQDALPMDYYLGASWWSLTHEAVKEILGHSSRQSDFTRRFRYSWAPARSFFHTILGNSALAQTCRSRLHYSLSDLSKPGADTPPADLSAILPTSSKFVGFLAGQLSVEQLDQLDELRQRSSPTAVSIAARKNRTAWGLTSKAATREKPLGITIDYADIVDAEIIIRGHTPEGVPPPAQLLLRPRCAPDLLTAAMPAAPERSDESPLHFEFRLPLSDLPALADFDFSILLKSDLDHPIPYKHGETYKLDVLRIHTREWFFLHVQNRATHVKDATARLRLLDEGMALYRDDAEVQVAGFCIRGYAALESGASAESLDHLLAQRQNLEPLLPHIKGGKQVRWTGSSFTMLAYISIKRQQWQLARACLERVVQMAPRAGEWPSIELNVMRAYFSIGFLACVEGDYEVAENRWGRALTFCQHNIGTKDFKNYYKIEESHAALGVASLCSIGLAKLRRKRSPLNAATGKVSGQPLVPSAAHPGYLRPLDALDPGF